MTKKQSDSNQADSGDVKNNDSSGSTEGSGIKRRKLLEAIAAAGGGVVLSKAHGEPAHTWQSPQVKGVDLPSHAVATIDIIPTPTPSMTPGATATPTPSPSMTPGASPTPTPTPSMTPGATPTPTPTPSLAITNECTIDAISVQQNGGTDPIDFSCLFDGLGTQTVIQDTTPESCPGGITACGFSANNQFLVTMSGLAGFNADRIDFGQCANNGSIVSGEGANV